MTTHWLDQTDSESIQSLWAQVGKIKFDIMIDGGLHTYDAGIILFENSIHMLASTGISIIEDIGFEDLASYQKYFKKHPNFHAEITMLSTCEEQQSGNNILTIQQR